MQNSHQKSIALLLRGRVRLQQRSITLTALALTLAACGGGDGGMSGSSGNNNGGGNTNTTSITLSLSLREESDTGVSSTDLITMDNTLSLNLASTEETMVTFTAESSAGETVNISTETFAKSEMREVNTGTLSDGMWTITAQATHSNSAIETVTKTLMVTIDTVAPSGNTASITGDSDLSGIASNIANGFTINSSQDVSSVMYSLRSGDIELASGVVMITNGTGNTGALTITGGINALVLGSNYSLDLTATDTAGNVQTQADSLTVEVSESSVNIEGVVDSNGQLITNDNTPEFSLVSRPQATAIITATKGDQTFTLPEQTVDADGMVDVSINSDSPLDDGEWTVMVQYTFPNGDSSEQSLMFSVDTTPPSNDSAQAVIAGDTDLVANASAIENGFEFNTDSDVVSVTYSLRRGQTVLASGEATITNRAGVSGMLTIDGGIDSLTPGEYTLDLISSDAAGNRQISPNSLTVTVSEEGAVEFMLSDDSLTGMSPKGINGTMDSSPSFTIQGNEGDTFIVNVMKTGREGESIDVDDVSVGADGMGTIDLDNLGDGEWVLSLTPKNGGDSITVPFVVDTMTEQPADIIIAGKKKLAGSSDVILSQGIMLMAEEESDVTFRILDDMGDVVSSGNIKIDEEGNGDSGTIKLANGETSLDPGILTIEFTVNDPYGNMSLPFTVDWEVIDPANILSLSFVIDGEAELPMDGDITLLGKSVFADQNSMIDSIMATISGPAGGTVQIMAQSNDDSEKSSDFGTRQLGADGNADIVLPKLTDGTWTFNLQITGDSSNTETINSEKYLIDTNSPITPTIYFANNQRFSVRQEDFISEGFSLEAKEPGGKITFDIKDPDGTSLQKGTATLDEEGKFTSGTLTITKDNLTPESDYSIDYTVVDKAGNETSGTSTFAVDDDNALSISLDSASNSPGGDDDTDNISSNKTPTFNIIGNANAEVMITVSGSALDSDVSIQVILDTKGMGVFTLDSSTLGKDEDGVALTELPEDGFYSISAMIEDETPDDDTNTAESFTLGYQLDTAVTSESAATINGLSGLVGSVDQIASGFRIYSFDNTASVSYTLKEGNKDIATGTVDYTSDGNAGSSTRLFFLESYKGMSSRALTTGDLEFIDDATLEVGKTYTLNLITTDIAGNTLPSASLEVMVVVPLEIQFDSAFDTGESNTDGITSELVQKLIIKGPGGAQLMIVADRQGSGDTINLNADLSSDGDASLDLKGLTEGIWSVTAVNAGNGTSDSLVVVIDTTPPPVPSISLARDSDLTVTSDKFVSNGFLLKGEPETSIMYVVKNSSGTEVYSGDTVIDNNGRALSGRLVGIQMIDLGADYTVEASALDKAGNASETVTVTVMILNAGDFDLVLDPTGVGSDSDNIVNINRPTFTLTGEAFSEEVSFSLVNSDSSVSPITVGNVLLGSNREAKILVDTDLSEGTWTLSAMLVSDPDTTVASQTVVIDTTPPKQVKAVSENGMLLSEFSGDIADKGFVFSDGEIGSIVRYKLKNSLNEVQASGEVEIGSDGQGRTGSLRIKDGELLLPGDGYTIELETLDVAGNSSGVEVQPFEIILDSLYRITLSPIADSGIQGDSRTLDKRLQFVIQGDPGSMIDVALSFYKGNFVSGKANLEARQGTALVNTDQSGLTLDENTINTLLLSLYPNDPARREAVRSQLEDAGTKEQINDLLAMQGVALDKNNYYYDNITLDNNGRYVLTLDEDVVSDSYVIVRAFTDESEAGNTPSAMGVATFLVDSKASATTDTLASALSGSFDTESLANINVVMDLGESNIPQIGNVVLPGGVVSRVSGQKLLSQGFGIENYDADMVSYVIKQGNTVIAEGNFNAFSDDITYEVEAISLVDGYVFETGDRLTFDIDFPESDSKQAQGILSSLTPEQRQQFQSLLGNSLTPSSNTNTAIQTLKLLNWNALFEFRDAETGEVIFDGDLRLNDDLEIVSSPILRRDGGGALDPNKKYEVFISSDNPSFYIVKSLFEAESKSISFSLAKNNAVFANVKVKLDEDAAVSNSGAITLKEGQELKDGEDYQLEITGYEGEEASSTKIVPLHIDNSETKFTVELDSKFDKGFSDTDRVTSSSDLEFKVSGQAGAMFEGTFSYGQHLFLLMGTIGEDGTFRLGKDFCLCPNPEDLSLLGGENTNTRLPNTDLFNGNWTIRLWFMDEQGQEHYASQVIMYSLASSEYGARANIVENNVLEFSPDVKANNVSQGIQLSAIRKGEATVKVAEGYKLIFGIGESTTKIAVNTVTQEIQADSFGKSYIDFQESADFALNNYTSPGLSLYTVNDGGETLNIMYVKVSTDSVDLSLALESNSGYKSGNYFYGFTEYNMYYVTSDNTPLLRATLAQDNNVAIMVTRYENGFVAESLADVSETKDKKSGYDFYLTGNSNADTTVSDGTWLVSQGTQGNTDSTIRIDIDTENPNAATFVLSGHQDLVGDQSSFLRGFLVTPPANENNLVTVRYILYKADEKRPENDVVFARGEVNFPSSTDGSERVALHTGALMLLENRELDAGEYELRIITIDAAGNSVNNDQTVTVAPSANTSLTVNDDVSTFTFMGQANVEVTLTATSHNTSEVITLGKVTTDANGALSITSNDLVGMGLWTIKATLPTEDFITTVVNVDNAPPMINSDIKVSFTGGRYTLASVADASEGLTFTRGVAGQELRFALLDNAGVSVATGNIVFDVNGKAQTDALVINNNGPLIAGNYSVRLYSDDDDATGYLVNTMLLVAGNRGVVYLMSGDAEYDGSANSFAFLYTMDANLNMIGATTLDLDADSYAYINLDTYASTPSTTALAITNADSSVSVPLLRGNPSADLSFTIMNNTAALPATNAGVVVLDNLTTGLSVTLSSATSPYSDKRVELQLIRDGKVYAVAEQDVDSTTNIALVKFDLSGITLDNGIYDLKTTVYGSYDTLSSPDTLTTYQEIRISDPTLSISLDPNDASVAFDMYSDVSDPRFIITGQVGAEVMLTASALNRTTGEFTASVQTPISLTIGTSGEVEYILGATDPSNTWKISVSVGGQTESIDISVGDMYSITDNPMAFAEVLFPTAGTNYFADVAFGRDSDYAVIAKFTNAESLETWVTNTVTNGYMLNYQDQGDITISLSNANGDIIFSGTKAVNGTTNPSVLVDGLVRGAGTLQFGETYTLTLTSAPTGFSQTETVTYDFTPIATSDLFYYKADDTASYRVIGNPNEQVIVKHYRPDETEADGFVTYQEKITLDAMGEGNGTVLTPGSWTVMVESQTDMTRVSQEFHVEHLAPTVTNDDGGIHTSVIFGSGALTVNENDADSDAPISNALLLDDFIDNGLTFKLNVKKADSLMYVITNNANQAMIDGTIDINENQRIVKTGAFINIADPSAFTQDASGVSSYTVMYSLDYQGSIGTEETYMVSTYKHGFSSGDLVIMLAKDSDTGDLDGFTADMTPTLIIQGGTDTANKSFTLEISKYASGQVVGLKSSITVMLNDNGKAFVNVPLDAGEWQATVITDANDNNKYSYVFAIDGESNTDALLKSGYVNPVWDTLLDTAANISSQGISFQVNPYATKYISQFTYKIYDGNTLVAHGDVDERLLSDQSKYDISSSGRGSQEFVQFETGALNFVDGQSLTGGRDYKVHFGGINDLGRYVEFSSWEIGARSPYGVAIVLEKQSINGVIYHSGRYDADSGANGNVGNNADISINIRSGRSGLVELTLSNADKTLETVTVSVMRDSQETVGLSDIIALSYGDESQAQNLSNGEWTITARSDQYVDTAMFTVESAEEVSIETTGFGSLLIDGSSLDKDISLTFRGNPNENLVYYIMLSDSGFLADDSASGLNISPDQETRVVLDQNGEATITVNLFSLLEQRARRILSADASNAAVQNFIDTMGVYSADAMSELALTIQAISIKDENDNNTAISELHRFNYYQNSSNTGLLNSTPILTQATNSGYAYSVSAPLLADMNLTTDYGIEDTDDIRYWTNVMDIQFVAGKSDGGALTLNSFAANKNTAIQTVSSDQRYTFDKITLNAEGVYSYTITDASDSSMVSKVVNVVYDTTGPAVTAIMFVGDSNLVTTEEMFADITFITEDSVHVTYSIERKKDGAIVEEKEQKFASTTAAATQIVTLDLDQDSELYEAGDYVVKIAVTDRAGNVTNEERELTIQGKPIINVDSYYASNWSSYPKDTNDQESFVVEIDRDRLLRSDADNPDQDKVRTIILKVEVPGIDVGDISFTLNKVEGTMSTPITLDAKTADAFDIENQSLSLKSGILWIRTPKLDDGTYKITATLGSGTDAVTSAARTFVIDTTPEDSVAPSSLVLPQEESQETTSNVTQDIDDVPIIGVSDISDGFANSDLL